MTATQPHDSLTCKLGPDGQPCTMCWWANEGHIHDYQIVVDQSAPPCSCRQVYDYEADLLTPPPNFESAWATAPPEYIRYTEESHALYWYLCGMRDEQRITRLARRSLAREDAEEMGRLVAEKVRGK